MEDDLDFGDLLHDENSLDQSDFLDQITAYSETLLSNAIERRKLMQTTRPYSRWSPGTAAMAKESRKSFDSSPAHVLNLDGEIEEDEIGYSQLQQSQSSVRSRGSGRSKLLSPRLTTMQGRLFSDDSVLESNSNGGWLEPNSGQPSVSLNEIGSEGGDSTDSFLDKLDMQEVERKIKQLKAKLRNEKRRNGRKPTSPDSSSIGSFPSTDSHELSPKTVSSREKQRSTMLKSRNRKKPTKTREQLSTRPHAASLVSVSSKTIGGQRQPQSIAGKAATSLRSVTNKPATAQSTSKRLVAARSTSKQPVAARSTTKKPVAARSTTKKPVTARSATSKLGRVQSATNKPHTSVNTSTDSSLSGSATNPSLSRSRQSSRGTVHEALSTTKTSLSSRLELLARPRSAKTRETAKSTTQPRLRKTNSVKRDTHSDLVRRQQRMQTDSKAARKVTTKRRPLTSNKLVESSLRERLNLSQSALSEHRRNYARVIAEQRETKRQLRAANAQVNALNQRIRQLEIQHKKDSAQLRTSNETVIATRKSLEETKRKCRSLSRQLKAATTQYKNSVVPTSPAGQTEVTEEVYQAARNDSRYQRHGSGSKVRNAANNKIQDRKRKGSQSKPKVKTNAATSRLLWRDEVDDGAADDALSTRSTSSVASRRSYRSIGSSGSRRSALSAPVGESIRKSRAYMQYQRLKELYNEKYDD